MVVSYYHVFAWLYGLCGAFVDLAMVNSSWTRGHIGALWKLQPTIHTVFPPCDTKSLQVHHTPPPPSIPPHHQSPPSLIPILPTLITRCRRPSSDDAI